MAKSELRNNAGEYQPIPQVARVETAAIDPRWGWRWFAASVALLALVLAGFWLLLQAHYSPENYTAHAVAVGTVELAWIGLAIAAATLSVVAWRRDRSRWRQTATALVPAGVAGAAVAARVALGAEPRFDEILWFSAALGWAVAGIFQRPLRLPPWLVWGAALLLAAYYFHQQVGYLNDLALGYPDCGQIARRMHNTIHHSPELFLRVNPDKPLFFDHVDPGALPFIPLWAIWPDVRLTILLQLVAILGAAVPLYWMGRRLFDDRSAALWLVVIWLVYPSISLVIYSGSYGFRWGNLCLPLQLTALALWLRGRHGWALATALWAVALKEEAAIPIGMFGWYLALTQPRWRPGALLGLGAFAYFLFATSVIIPTFSPHGYELDRYFVALGGTKWEIFLALFTKPGAWAGRFFARDSACLFGALLAPLLFLPLKRPAILAVGTLTFVFICLDRSLKSLGFWWHLSLLPVAFWAFADAVRAADAPRRTGYLHGAVVSAAVLSIFLGNLPWSKPTIFVPRSPRRAELVKQFRADIPRDASLFATPRAAMWFVDQHSLFLDQPLPSQLDYALIDLRVAWRESGDARWLRPLRQLQRNVEGRGDLHLVRAEDGLLLYARQGPPLDARGRVETNEPGGPAVSLTDGVRVAVSAVTSTPDHQLRVAIRSSVAVATNVDLAARCVLRHGGGESFASLFQPLGQGVWPISRWEPGQWYADEFLVPVPAGLDPRDFRLEFEAVRLQ